MSDEKETENEIIKYSVYRGKQTSFVCQILKFVPLQHLRLQK